MDHGQIRAEARQHLSGRWVLAAGVAALAWLLGGTLLGNSFFPEFSYHFRGENITLKDAVNTALTVVSQFGSSSIKINLLTLGQLLIGGVIQLGYAGILLKQHGDQAYTVSDLCSQFHRFGQGFAQKFLRELYCFLWGLLFIIPGIIAGLSYAMTPFLMAEHPEMSAGEAIACSKELMDGHKWDLFVLHLSFIGWDLLAMVTLGLGNLVLNPYKNAAEAAFYRKITGTSTME